MLGSGLPALFGAAVSPTSTEFTREVSRPGAQINKSDASADSATPASDGNLYVFPPIIKRMKYQRKVMSLKMMCLQLKLAPFSTPAFSVCALPFLL